MCSLSQFYRYGVQLITFGSYMMPLGALQYKNAHSTNIYRAGMVLSFPKLSALEKSTNKLFRWIKHDQTYGWHQFYEHNGRLGTNHQLGKLSHWLSSFIVY